jgi:putative DNA-invertase from lambdoid prophage Rac
MDGHTSVNLVGYVRVSSADQSEHGQVDALRRAGASRIVVEKASGVAERPLLDELISGLEAGDALAVTEVSRLGRTVSDILLLVDDLHQRGVHLRILNLGIDTGTPAGGLVLTMMAGLAKYERELLRERQRRGIEAARQRGKHLGRPALLTASHADTAILRLQTESLAVIASEWRVSERTLSRLVKKYAGEGPLPLLPGGKGKPKRRGRINQMEGHRWRTC